jgi:16S rRNA (cytosine967-C5)-methyltransferase
VLQGDAARPADWWQGPQFDRILLDAPCSATGVIRRHPDIKWLRRQEDIAQLAALQGRILDALWARLKPGGTLLYATCSILPDENGEQIRAFLQPYPGCAPSAAARARQPGAAGLAAAAGQAGRDGFYYAKLSKKA